MEGKLNEKFNIQLLVVQTRSEDFLSSGPRVGIKGTKDLQYNRQDGDGPLDGVSLIFTFVSQFISQSRIQNKVF